MSSQPEPRILFNREEIEAAVKRLAAEIRKDYLGKHPILIGILKGSFMFMADLIRLLDFPLEVEFVRYPAMVVAGKLRARPGRCRVFFLQLKAGMFWLLRT